MPGVSCRVTIFYIERLLVIPCGIDSAAIKIDDFSYICFFIMAVYIDELPVTVKGAVLKGNVVPIYRVEAIATSTIASGSRRIEYHVFIFSGLCTAVSNFSVYSAVFKTKVVNTDEALVILNSNMKVYIFKSNGFFFLCSAPIKAVVTIIFCTE